MFAYFKHPLKKKCRLAMYVVTYFSAFSITASFLIVFAFTVTQYIVVSSPLRYGRLVTKTKVLISVVVIYLYSATFWCLPLMGVSSYVQSIIDLFVHMYLLVLVTIAIYILLHLAMKKKMAAANSLQGRTGAQDNGKHVQVQRNFVRVNFMLIVVLIVCATPAAVLWTVRLFMDNPDVPSAKTLIANLMVDNLLYLKFLLDPFVYAWRMPRYRNPSAKFFVAKMSAGNRVEMETRAISSWQLEKVLMANQCLLWN
ncbi:hypothetical protein OS493_032086 [Desmophyllum pertusum]|uniref:G-protein coupled receptors family 1 profile domain-containing protein n=1 Tax=Desmophyllum pertusum TaxID=174260 RepID=A0A9W9YJG7_9CNID|nr:hypothetical protein OS493_032086 [Desmophyllum pertusum]